jgi:hypothetical protein
MTAGFQVMLKLTSVTAMWPRAVSPVIKDMSEHIAYVKDTLMNSHPVLYKRAPSTLIESNR